jgi:saccharopine dehydrogenase-like NADP-dependent oxidoreductase
LEAFNSDGLRSLIYTLKADFMREKTLRYPGYVAKVKLLADAGFLNPEKVKLQDAEVSPLALSSQLLFEQWRLGKGEADLTVMRVVVKGFKNGVSQKYVSDLYDEFDAVSQVHSMARTTGYAATTALRFLMQDSHIEPGILLPEKFALVSGVFDFMLAGLKDHGVEYSNTEFSMH